MAELKDFFYLSSSWNINNQESAGGSLKELINIKQIDIIQLESTDEVDLTTDVLNFSKFLVLEKLPVNQEPCSIQISSQKK